VAVLNFGKILQMGTPEEIYTTPASLWIAGFLGFSNQVPAKVIGLDPLLVSTSLGEFILPKKNLGVLKKNDNLFLVIQPEEIRLVKQTQGRNMISGVVQDSQFRGDGYRLTLRMANGTIFRFRDTMRRGIGQRIFLEIPQSTLLSYPSHE
jgi:ABC-type Fe3+/spermidine/putrescine transport system ATPase subunit